MLLLNETKTHSEAYSHNRLGYTVTCSTAHLSSAGGAQGGVRLVARERPVGWGIESTRYHRPIVVRCKLITGLTWTLLIIAYQTPSMLEHLTDLEE